MALNPLPESTKAERKRLTGLRRARERRESGQLLVEGATLLHEALRAGCAPRLVAVTEDEQRAHAALLERAAAAGARLVALEPRHVDAIADREHGPGLLAAVDAPAAWDGALPAEGPVLVLALAGIQDPGNVGTLLRSARAFGARGVWWLPGTADPAGPKVVRASAGAALALPVGPVSDASALAARCESSGLTLLRAEAPGQLRGHARAADEPDVLRALPERALLLLGHETRGVPAGLAGEAVCVPQAPEVESLNVAMAGSILMAGWYAAREART